MVAVGADDDARAEAALAARLEVSGPPKPRKNGGSWSSPSPKGSADGFTMRSARTVTIDGATLATRSA